MYLSMLSYRVGEGVDNVGYFYVSCCSMFWTNSRWLETVFTNFQDIDFDESYLELLYLS